SRGRHELSPTATRGVARRSVSLPQGPALVRLLSERPLFCLARSRQRSRHSLRPVHRPLVVAVETLPCMPEPLSLLHEDGLLHFPAARSTGPTPGSSASPPEHFSDAKPPHNVFALPPGRHGPSPHLQ